MILLGVNVDHVATLRQARRAGYPDPVMAALLAEQGGADGITVHLREDRRHIQERDLHLLMASVATKVNLEMAASDPMIALACALQPADCCLVPERREELTTEGGLEVVGQRPRLADAVSRLTAAGIRVSLFIDPEPAQIAAAHEVGAPVVELHTGRYAEARTLEERRRELIPLGRAVEQGLALGLTVNAGHGLNYHNVQDVAAIAGLHELNIGHAIIARAVFTGIEAAVREMKRLMREAASPAR